MPTVTIKPTDAALKRYKRALDELEEQGVTHEGGLRSAFGALLRETAKKHRNWTLVEELSEGRVRPDGTLRDQWQLPHGYWEAKDGSDDLDAEIRRKRERGYPFSNILFEDTREAVLYQDERRVLRTDLGDHQGLARLLTQFYSHEMEHFRSFEEAVAHFSGEVPHIAQGIQELIDRARRDNRDYQRAFADFMALCSEALNPNISRAAVEEMLIQHMLTERLISKVFDQENFVRRNVIAAEVEKVIDALMVGQLNRREFLGSLDRFYTAIEGAAERLADFHDKQGFINTVYERFFQGFSVRVADTHGIVYTPQEVVDFMCAATEELLQREFGKRLGDAGVCVIDPCTGTGNFVINLLRRVAQGNRRELERFYRERLFANEVMLMPYYIASLNIEREFYDQSGHYEAFDGLCFVDTLDLAEGKIVPLGGGFSEKNNARVERQKAAKINVIIGNPPYNVGQLNENDNNKNRNYRNLEEAVRVTYAADSRSTLRAQLYDAYVKFFRWASNRLGGREGIVCLVTNNSFVEGTAFDGMRRELMRDFTRIFHVDLAGNFRKGKGEGENVFGNVTSVGVGITFALRSAKHKQPELHYHRVPDDMSAANKRAYLAESVDSNRGVMEAIDWKQLRPDARHTWLRAEHAEEFARFLPLGTKEAKAAKNKTSLAVETVFKVFSNGVKTNRDSVVYDFDRRLMAERVEEFVEEYNAEVDRYRRHDKPTNVDDFVKYDQVEWSSTLKAHLRRGRYAKYSESSIRSSLYRPFTKRSLYFDRTLMDRCLLFPHILPTPETEQENLAICLTAIANTKPFHALITNIIPDLHLTGDSQCFPLYTYDEDGTNRRENVTDWALATFRERYGDAGINKLDIFHYVYGLLHHPGYRERHADSLKRELPRIPMAPDFAAFRDAGKELARLHLNYEHERPWRLDWETADGPVEYRVEKMRPLKRVQSEDGDYRIFDSLQYNDTLTLRGIPPKAFRYRLGTRSALEWVVDQYRVKTDKRSGIVSDPNAWSEDQQYIVNLVGRVLRVSVETVNIVDDLADLPLQ